MTDLQAIPVHNFTTPPPKVPRLYFGERKLGNLAIWGGFALVNPGSVLVDQWPKCYVGSWRIHFDIIDPFSEEAAKEPWKLLAQMLPGMRVSYEDFATEEQMIWVLTDDIVRRDNNNDLRLGVWPD